MKKIVCFASGNGTNFQSLIDSVHAKHAFIIALITDNPEAGAIARAKEANIAVHAFDYRQMGREAFEQKTIELLSELEPDLAVLCGFLKAYPSAAIQKWPAINIHPSLLPSFSGKGMYGLRVHEAAIDYGVKVSGCSVHFVTEEIDAGPIILQMPVDVLERDTPETLQTRILEYEHKAIVKAAMLFCSDRIKISGRRAIIS
ncbi:MAG: phosphoribosylglycinamide formyltransferase [Eubacteriaceae bacterium]|jgi:phosphoribosylglycinamide formyltransferase-1|nr:phosphoribosylglycinamide formyltransferase [Eubacteriaceae bacterium]